MEAQLSLQRVEGAGPQLAERPDVVPVAVNLVDVERDVVLEQDREDFRRPVDERAPGEVLEDRGIEHVDAAIGEVRERFIARRLLLKAGDAPVAIAQHDAVLLRLLDALDGEGGDPARFAVRAVQRGEVDVGERVAGDDDEGLAA